MTCPWFMCFGLVPVGIYNDVACYWKADVLLPRIPIAINVCNNQFFIGVDVAGPKEKPHCVVNFTINFVAICLNTLSCFN